MRFCPRDKKRKSIGIFSRNVDVKESKTLTLWRWEVVRLVTKARPTFLAFSSGSCLVEVCDSVFLFWKVLLFTSTCLIVPLALNHLLVQWHEAWDKTLSHEIFPWLWDWFYFKYVYLKYPYMYSYTSPPDSISAKCQITDQRRSLLTTGGNWFCILACYRTE